MSERIELEKKATLGTTRLPMLFYSIVRSCSLVRWDAYLQTTFDKLLDRDNTVLVEIKFLEDPVQLLPRLPFLLGLMSLAHELVDRRHDFAQLAPGDAAIAVYVVQFEGPSQFFVDAAPQQGRQRHEEILQPPVLS